MDPVREVGEVRPLVGGPPKKRELPLAPLSDPPPSPGGKGVICLGGVWGASEGCCAFAVGGEDFLISERSDVFPVLRAAEKKDSFEIFQN